MKQESGGQLEDTDEDLFYDVFLLRTAKTAKEREAVLTNSPTGE